MPVTGEALAVGGRPQTLLPGLLGQVLGALERLGVLLAAELVEPFTNAHAAILRPNDPPAGCSAGSGGGEGEADQGAGHLLRSRDRLLERRDEPVEILLGDDQRRARLAQVQPVAG